MVITIDGDQHVRLKLGFVYAILVSIVGAAFYVAFTVSQFQAGLETLSSQYSDTKSRTDILEAKVTALQANNADVATKIAVLDTKITAIDGNTRDIKTALRIT